VRQPRELGFFHSFVGYVMSSSGAEFGS